MEFVRNAHNSMKAPCASLTFYVLFLISLSSIRNTVTNIIYFLSCRRSIGDQGGTLVFEQPTDPQ